MVRTSKRKNVSRGKGRHVQGVFDFVARAGAAEKAVRTNEQRFKMELDTLRDRTIAQYENDPAGARAKLHETIAQIDGINPKVRRNQRKLARLQTIQNALQEALKDYS